MFQRIEKLVMMFLMALKKVKRFEKVKGPKGETSGPLATLSVY